MSVVDASGCDVVQRAGKKTQLVRQVVREVVGLMPYEKRILDMIKSGGSSAEKRIYKFSKKRVRAVAWSGGPSLRRLLILTARAR
jgi:hypothetical protein